MADLVRFYCKNCRFDTTIATGLPRLCPRCKCGVELDELYPGQFKLGKGYISPNTLKSAPTYNDGVNQSPNKRNSGTRLNSPGKFR
jgi:hypothetical protein